MELKVAANPARALRAPSRSRPISLAVRCAPSEQTPASDLLVRAHVHSQSLVTQVCVRLLSCFCMYVAS